MLLSGSMALLLEFSVVHVLSFVHSLVLSSSILSVCYIVPSLFCFPSSILCHLNSGSMVLLIARGVSVRIHCSCSRFVHILAIVYVFNVIVLCRLSFGSSSSFGSLQVPVHLLSFCSAILLIARCASVRICCSHSQFCPRPRFVHILVLVHILSISCSVILSFLSLAIVYPRYLVISFSLFRYLIVLYYPRQSSSPFFVRIVIGYHSRLVSSG
jgi:hypothetical protein